jgi:hypothetical protein
MDDNEYCPYCLENINPEERSMELPCFHRVHTLCFLNLMNNPTRSLAVTHQQCELCHIPLFPEVEEEEQEETPPVPEAITPQPNYYERIRIRVQGDEHIKKDLKLYFKAKYNEGRKRTALLKYTREKKNEIKNSVDTLREQLRNLIRAQKRVIVQSQPYKEYKGAHFRRNILGARFHKKYNLDLKDLRKAMFGQPGYKRWYRESRWRSNPNYILRRGFYRSYLRL